MKVWDWGRAGVVAAVLALGCGERGPAPARSAAAVRAKPELGAPLRAQALQRTAYLQFAVYYRSGDADAEALARAEITRQRRLQAVAKVSEQPAEPQISLAAPPIDGYAPPSGEMLDRFGRGIESADRDRLRSVDRVLVMEVVSPAEQATAAHEATLALVASLARELDGYAWDEVTRELFSTSAWQARVTSFSEPPNVAHHVTTHLYRAHTGPRLITLGMVKFGLPDIVIERLPASSAEPMNALAILVCQTLLERSRIERDGKLDVDITKLKNRALRDELRGAMMKGARGGATLAVAEGRWEDGDPHNRLVEIVFPGSHEDLHVRQDEVISKVFGFAESLVRTQHDEELEAASQRAKRELMALKPRFATTAAGAEVLLVKAPFKTSSGKNEWMWVEVTSWKGSTIHGILQNQPVEVPELRSGARVSFDESVVFDYIHQRDDGSEVGNETGRILMRRQDRSAAD